MTNYVIPFTYPEDMKAVELCGMLKAHNIDIGARTSYTNNEYLIKGTMENLIEFFIELDGPAQSFDVDEFVHYVEENNHLA